MKITLTKELEEYVNAKVQSGRYADASEVMREALRTLEQRDDLESPALEAALLEGARSPPALLQVHLGQNPQDRAPGAMKLSVVIPGRAEADLTNQWRWFLENANLETAERFLQAFDATIAKLAGMPSLGRMRRFRSPELAGVRSFPVSNDFSSHLIFYHVTEWALSIERVMHGARDLEYRLVVPPERPTP